MKEEKEKKKDCGCGDPNCKCGDDCECKGGSKKCKCKCHEHECHCHEHDHEHCDCNHEPTIEDYQKAFDQFEQTLIKVDAELTKAKQEAEDNQRIAISFRKDLERYKERNKNIEEEAKANAIVHIANELIPILDQFEMALAGGGDENTKKGYQMIYVGLKKSIENLGITEIAALDMPFDSNYHSAVSKCQTTDQAKDGVVTAVYQKGYKLNDKVIRYAQVEIGEYTK